MASISRYAAALLAVAVAIGAISAVAQVRRASEPPVPKDDMWQPRHLWGDEIVSPTARARMQRHWTYMRAGVPPEYRGLAPPGEATQQSVSRGLILYQENCAACHGIHGLGGGDRALGMAPSPALLAHMIQRRGAADEYLMWTISEGGKAFGTAMPSFKENLSRAEIWDVIAYMRAGFPKPRN
jgi:mono/diheme cytochrome c family protein